jgi:hypothetical protein
MTLENLWARTNESTKLFDFRDEDAGKYRFFPKGAPRPKSVGAKPGKTAVPKLEGIYCGNGEDPKTNGLGTRGAFGEKSIFASVFITKIK